jgi:hypothetical protein
MLGAEGRITRRTLREIIQRNFNLDALTPHQRSAAKHELCEALLTGAKNVAQMARLIFGDDRFAVLADAPQIDIARFLRVDPAVVSRARRWCGEHGDEEVIFGRPPILPEEKEQFLREWVAARCSSQNWPTITDFKRVVISTLEEVNDQYSPSRGYFPKLFHRLLSKEFKVRLASPLEEDRYRVTPEIIIEHFRKLAESNLCKCDPHMIVNVDETGFGTSKSGRMPSRKVIVPLSYKGQPTYCYSVESYFVSAICSISVAGDVLPPGLITVRGTDHSDAEKLPFSATSFRYSSEKAFITRRIFEDYLSKVVLAYFSIRRQEFKQPDLPGFIIYDGHESHISELISAWAAKNNITLYLLPSHSSHLVQPLDQGFFRKVKAEFASSSPLKGFSAVSSTCERINMALQAANQTLTIWNSWKLTGMTPIIRKGVCTGIELCQDEVLKQPSLQHVTLPVRNNAQGRRIRAIPFGVLNEAEALEQEAGRCPLCGKRRDESRRYEFCLVQDLTLISNGD